MPKLKEIYAEFCQNERFAMVGLALDGDRKKLENFVKKNDIRWPQIELATEFSDPICKAYELKGIPTDYIIGPDGKLIGNFHASQGKESINLLISK